MLFDLALWRDHEFHLVRFFSGRFIEKLNFGLACLLILIGSFRCLINLALLLFNTFSFLKPPGLFFDSFALTSLLFQFLEFLSLYHIDTLVYKLKQHMHELQRQVR